MTYAELKAQFNAILNRTDITDSLTTIFINQAQTRAQRSLRIPAQETVATTTVTDGFIGTAVPTDFMQTIAMIADSNGSNIEYVPLSRFYEIDDDTTGVPKYFTRRGATFLFKPTPTTDSTITHLYYGELTPLVLDADETVISTVAPDLIIYGALSYAADYFLDERGANFEQRYQSIADDLQNQAYDAEGPGVIQPAYSFGSD